MILVTGGAGFIGSHLAEFLLKKGNSVKILDNLVSGKSENLAEGVEFVNEDICKESIGDVFSEVETVFHLAADPDVRSSVKNPSVSFKINIDGSFNVLEASRRAGVKNFIFASSGGTVYGDTSEPVTEKHPLRPISPYGASKAAFEMYLSAYAHAYGMNCSALRLGNVIGPRSEHGVIWDFFWKLRKNPDELEILGNGLQEKSYIHVDDVVSAFDFAWRRTKKFEAYNVASEGTLTVKQIAELVSEELGLHPKFRFTGGERGWTGDVKKSVMDMSKIKGLGWNPKYSQEEAVRKYVSWLIDKHT